MRRMNDISFFDRPEVAQFIFYPRRDPQPKDPAILLPVEVAKGVRIVCRFYRATQGIATILYFHGNGETAGDYDMVSSLYTERGINLLVADYRGYGLSDGTPSLRSLLEDCHPILAAAKGFLAQGGVAEALFVMGRSLGSIPAIELAASHQGELAGLVVESGFSDAVRLMAYLGLPLRVSGLGSGFPNGERIRQVQIPTLLIHGAEDSLIPIGEAEELYQLSPAADKRLVVIPGGDHNTLMMVGRGRYFAAIEEFIQKYKRDKKNPAQQAG